MTKEKAKPTDDDEDEDEDDFGLSKIPTDRLASKFGWEAGDIDVTGPDEDEDEEEEEEEE